MAKGLKPLQHIKKKEIKEDKLVTTYFQVRDYMDQNKKNLIKYGGGGLLLIALVVFWFSSKSGAEYDASYELGVAMMVAGQSEPAALADNFAQIADRYNGTTAGNEALLYAAQMKRMANLNEEALEAYNNYIRRGDKGKFLYPAAFCGKAACLEDLNRFEEAAETYLRAASSHRDFFMAPRFILDAARCYRLADMPDQARTQYEAVIEQYPDTDFSREAESGIRKI